MERTITGFHCDGAGDWVAELACGHNQHVRHKPPFQVRPWVLDEAGRSVRIGTPLNCVLCDRCELPASVTLTRTSPEWSETTMPTGLRRQHRLAPGTWGQITVHHGHLSLSMANDPDHPRDLKGPGATQAIPPEVVHEVMPLGRLRFAIEFFAVDRRPGAASNDEAPDANSVDLPGDPACWAGLFCPECGVVLDGSAHRPDCRWEIES